MATKNKLIYRCRECGFESAKWMGKCPGCGEWNTFEETIKEPVTPQKKLAGNGGRLSRPTPITRSAPKKKHAITRAFPSWIGYWEAALSKGRLS